jgi:hypothetical protein
MKARLADMGGLVLSGSPVDFGRLIADETEKWARVTKFANPVFHVTAITRRRDALFQTLTIGGATMSCTDTAQLTTLRTEVLVWRSLRNPRAGRRLCPASDRRGLQRRREDQRSVTPRERTLQ